MYLEAPIRRRGRVSIAVITTVGAGVGLAVLLLPPAPPSPVPTVPAAKTKTTAPELRSPADPHPPRFALAPGVTPPAEDAARFEMGGTLAPAAEAPLAAPPRDTADPASTSSARTPSAPPPAPPPRRVDLEVASGDTLMGMLLRLGIGRAEAHAAVEGLRDVYDPRRLRPGQQLQIETDAAAERLVRLAFAPSGRERIELVRADDGGFEALVEERATVVEQRLVEAEVTTSLHAAATGAGVPPGVFARIVKIFSWDVDYQRETRPGDRFAVLFERERVPGGSVVAAGEVRYARLEIGGRVLEAFRFDRDGEPEFFTRDGASLRKFLLRTPVSGGRLSSGFGMRRHPILGYNRMHRGVDFAAPTGTPIYAAGSGRLARVGRYGGYGNYVRIEHGDGYATAYAHLSRFAAGMRSGRRVDQGEVIGYVGSTGRSTGPHLHFEVLVNGEQVDPLAVAQPPAENLEGARLAAFRREVATVETRLAELGGRTFAADRRPRAASDG